MKKTVSLYFHIPFCDVKCHYCDFFSGKSATLSEKFLDALFVEIDLTREKYHLDNHSIKTIYCGGGTPSVLTEDQWQRFSQKLNSSFDMSTLEEWSTECNPESFTESKARVWLDSGVTRLTFGTQTLNDTELKALNRIHDSKRALTVFNTPILNEFYSVGVDLMYGIPHQTTDTFKDNIKKLLSIPVVKHLSIYELSIEPDTYFGKHRNTLPLPSEPEIEAFVEIVQEELPELDFYQYEISNFSRKGFESKHNKVYWEHEPYIAFGPSGHSFFDNKRFGNERSMQKYFALLDGAGLPIEFCDELSIDELLEEMIFLGFRTSRGVDEEKYLRIGGESFYSGKRKTALDSLVSSGFIERKGRFWCPTVKGIYFADGITGRLVD